MNDIPTPDEVSAALAGIDVSSRPQFCVGRGDLEVAANVIRRLHARVADLEAERDLCVESLNGRDALIGGLNESLAEHNRRIKALRDAAYLAMGKLNNAIFRVQYIVKWHTDPNCDVPGMAVGAGDHIQAAKDVLVGAVRSTLPEAKDGWPTPVVFSSDEELPFRVLHVKRGTTYTVLAKAELQSSAGPVREGRRSSFTAVRTGRCGRAQRTSSPMDGSSGSASRLRRPRAATCSRLSGGRKPTAMCCGGRFPSRKPRGWARLYAWGTLLRFTPIQGLWRVETSAAGPDITRTGHACRTLLSRPLPPGR